MFADSLCDSAGTNRSHRGWTTLASFAVQALAIGGLLILPLLYTQGLPQLQWIRSDPLVPPPAPGPRDRATNTSASNTTGRIPLPPAHIPSSIENLHEAEVVPQAPDLPLGYGIRRGSGDHGAGNGVP